MDDIKNPYPPKVITGFKILNELDFCLKINKGTVVPRINFKNVKTLLLDILGT
jgi:hypothetical protein